MTTTIPAGVGGRVDPGTERWLAADADRCYGSGVPGTRRLRFASVGLSLLFIILPAAVVGQEGNVGLESPQMSAQPPGPREHDARTRPAENRFTWLWFLGAVGFYFALQLWILPKMGVPT